MTLGIIGAGLGRTGTLSLRIALEQLGFGPCYHMLEVFKRPDHIAAWTRAAEGESVDWDETFREFGSAVDWPTCAFYRELSDHFRAAKVILTVRDPDRWYRSAADTIFPTMLADPPADNEVLQGWSRMVRKLIRENAFSDRLHDKAHAISVYEKHNEEVQNAISPSRLLVYEVAQGWEPLCEFLGVPVPEAPFPQANTTDEFRDMIAPMLGRLQPADAGRARH
jgi:hypothetical protein